MQLAVPAASWTWHDTDAAWPPPQLDIVRSEQSSLSMVSARTEFGAASMRVATRASASLRGHRTSIVRAGRLALRLLTSRVGRAAGGLGGCTSANTESLGQGQTGKTTNNVSPFKRRYVNAMAIKGDNVNGWQ